MSARKMSYLLAFSMVASIFVWYIYLSNLESSATANQNLSPQSLQKIIEDMDEMFNLNLIGYDMNELDKQKTTIILQSYCHGGDIHRLNILLYILIRYRTYCLVLYDIVLIWGCGQTEINAVMLAKIKKINESAIKCNIPNRYNKKRHYKWYKPLNHSNLKPPNIHVYKRHNTLSERWKILKFHKFNTLTAIIQDDDRIYNQLHFYCYLNTFNVLQFGSNNIFHLNAYTNYSNYIQTVGVLGSISRHFWDVIGWENATIRYNKYIKDLKRTIGIHTLLEKRMFFMYSAWSLAPFKNYSFDMIEPGATLVVPIYIYHFVNIMFEKYNLSDIIDNQAAMCDDIAYSLSLYFYFSDHNKLFMKFYDPSNYIGVGMCKNGNIDGKQFYNENKYPLLNMTVTEWENIYTIQDSEYQWKLKNQSMDNYYNMTVYGLDSESINNIKNATSYILDRMLSGQNYRIKYRHECINLLLWQYYKQHLDQTNFPHSLNIHRHYQWNSKINLPCISEK
eukprot:535595_1